MTPPGSSGDATGPARPTPPMATPKPRPLHVLDPEAAALCTTYARALLQTVPDDADAEDLWDELVALTHLLDEHPELDKLLTAALLNVRQRRELVDRVFGGRVSERTEGLLGVLSRNGRLGLLRGIAGSYRDLLHRREGKVEVTVRTAHPLSDAEQDDLKRRLREAFDAEPLLRLRVDGDLLAGCIVQVGDERFDASVAGELDRMRQRLVAARQRLLNVKPTRDREDDPDAN